MPILYSLRSHPDGFMMAKFDPDFNVAAIYHLTPVHTAKGADYSCECPAGIRPTCRHRKMIPIFIRAQAVDTTRFYCYETQAWHQPIPTYGEGEASAEKAALSGSLPSPDPKTFTGFEPSSPSKTTSSGFRRL